MNIVIQEDFYIIELADRTKIRTKMNLFSPISELMTRNLITVKADCNLAEVKEKFDKGRFHHLPVVDGKKIIGIISKSDLLYFLEGLNEQNENETIMKSLSAQRIMTKGMAKVESTDKINVALEVFKVNLFHAIPVVDNNELVGILTTYDIIKGLADGKLTQ